MKMVIIAVVMAIVIPAAFLGLNLYLEKQSELNTRLELEKLVTEIHSAHGGGNGTTRIIELSFSESIMSSIEYIKIGDNILPLGPDKVGDPYATWIRYRTNEDSEKRLEVGNLVTNRDMSGPLVLTRGDYKLKLIHWNMVGVESFVTVEII